MQKLILILGSTLLLMACSQGPFGLTWNSDGVQKANINDGLRILNNPFRDQALAIINQNCVGCHGETAGPKGVFNLLSLNHLVSSGLVVPGNPEQSKLFQVIKTGLMPMKGRLSEIDQSTIQNWIASGDVAASKPTAPGPLPPTFANIESKILQVRCVMCHSGPKPKGQVSLDTYEGVMKTVDVSSPEESSIYVQTYSGMMPPRGDLLTTDEQKALLTWIKEGALNN